MLNESDNIEINLNRKKKNSYEIYLFTVMHTSQLYLEAMKYNMQLNNVKKVIIFAPSYAMNKLDDNNKMEIIDTGLVDINEITYNYIFDYIMKHYEGKVCILMRSDVYLENQNSLELLPFYLKNNVFLCISALSVNEDGQVSKDEDKMKTFYSMNQDCWIFIPNESNAIDFSSEKQVKFNVSRNEIVINKILDKKYNLINDTDNFRVMKIVPKGENIDKLRMEGEVDTSGGIKLLPETTVANKVNIENLIKFLELDEFELYKLKAELLEKVLIKRKHL